MPHRAAGNRTGRTEQVRAAGRRVARDRTGDAPAPRARLDSSAVPMFCGAPRCPRLARAAGADVAPRRLFTSIDVASPRGVPAPATDPPFRQQLPASCAPPPSVPPALGAGRRVVRGVADPAAGQSESTAPQLRASVRRHEEHTANRGEDATPGCIGRSQARAAHTRRSAPAGVRSTRQSGTRPSHARASRGGRRRPRHASVATRCRLRH